MIHTTFPICPALAASSVLPPAGTAGRPFAALVLMAKPPPDPMSPTDQPPLAELLDEEGDAPADDLGRLQGDGGQFRRSLAMTPAASRPGCEGRQMGGYPGI